MKPTIQTERYTLYHADCLDVLPTLVAGSVDAVITDPPYGIGYASSKTKRPDGSPRRSRASFGEDVAVYCWIPHAFRLLDIGSMYCFTRWDVLHLWKQEIEQAGFKVRERLVWNKSHWKMGDLDYYGSQLEDCLFAIKGRPPMQYSKRRGNLFTSSSSSYLPEGQYDHPTQKSEAIITEFVLDCTNEGDLIIDPFMGSGTTGSVCGRLKRRFIGIEKVGYHFDIAAARIANAYGDYTPTPAEKASPQLSLLEALR